MGVVAISFVELDSLLFWVTKNFRNFQKKMKRLFLRGSSSQGSKDKPAKEKEKAKYNLPRVAEVRRVNGLVMISWKQPGFMKTFILWLIMRASPISSTTRSKSISYSPILSCKTFTIILRIHLLRYLFIYMMRLRKCHYVTFARFVEYPLRAA